MARARYFNIGTAADYAAVHGVSLRTARRRLAADPTAVKTGRGWKVPLPSTAYAKVKGISPSTARRKGTRSDNPTELTRGRVAKPPSNDLIPWQQIDRRLIRNPDRNPYQYQGAAVVVFLVSGDTRTVYTHNFDSRVPLTYKRLDEETRRWVAENLGTSPYDILRTFPARAVSHRPYPPLRAVA